MLQTCYLLGPTPLFCSAGMRSSGAGWQAVKGLWALVLLLALAALVLRLRGRSLPLRVPFGHRSSAAPDPSAPQGVTREAAVDSVSHAVEDVQLSSASLQHALAALPAPSPTPPGWFEAAAPWTAPPGTNFTYQGLHDKLTALLSVQASPAGWVSILTMSAGIKVPSGVPACKQHPFRPSRAMLCCAEVRGKLCVYAAQVSAM